MPFQKNGKRDYDREADWEKKKKPQRASQRALRMRARRAAEKAGKVTKHDNKQVDHITPLSRGGTNSNSNQRITSDFTNMSFSRNRDGSLRSQTSRKERKSR